MNKSNERDFLEELLHSLHGYIFALDKNQQIIAVLPNSQYEKFKNKTLHENSYTFTIGTLHENAALKQLFPEADKIVLYSSMEEKLNLLKKAYKRSKKVIKKERRKFQEALYGLERRNKQSIREMNLAVEMQKSMLPRSYPETSFFCCTHRYIPMAMVGGDYFDIFQIDEYRFGIMISDVSGHGIAPAFITAMIKSTFDYLKAKHTHPSEAIRSLNEEFSKVITTNHYVTAFYGILDFKKYSIEYCNAGHPGQLIAHVDGSFTEMKTLGNPIIGLMDDFNYRDTLAEFHPGDIFCFFTDGIIESRGANEKMFGVEGIKHVLLENSSMSLDAIADTILTELIQFMETPAFEDDITLFLLGTDSEVH